MNRPKTYEQAVDAILAEMRQILVERQRKHGSASIDEVGEDGLYWLMRLKLGRMRAKWDGKQWTGDPTDDLLDQAGYAVIQLMRLRGQWGLPLADGKPHAEALEEQWRRWAEASEAVAGVSDAAVGIMRYGSGAIHVKTDPRTLIMQGGFMP